MAFKGTASKASSGASMAKYDVEVEGRLKALEAVAHPVPADGGGVLAERLSIIEAVLRKFDVISFEKLAAKERAERG